MSNAFLPFNVTQTNIMSLADYTGSTTRNSGVAGGIAFSPIHNRMFRDWSMMTAAIGQFISEAGLIAQSDDLPSLVVAFRSAISQGLDSATTTTQGVIRIATSSEVYQGTDNTTAVTPYTLSAQIINIINRIVPPGNQTTPGLLRLATNEEAAAGVLNTVAITPFQLAAAVPTLPQATETLLGGAFLATQTQATGATDNLRIMTPLRVDQAITARNLAPLSAPQLTGTTAAHARNTNPNNTMNLFRLTNVAFGLDDPTPAMGIDGDIFIKFESP